MKNNTFNYLFIFWILIILILTSVPFKHLPAQDKMGMDKVVHVTLYFIFSLLFLIRKSTLSPFQKFRILLLLSVLVPVLDETHQLFIPGRSFSYYDMLADFTGFMLTIFLYFNKKIPKMIKLCFNLF